MMITALSLSLGDLCSHELIEVHYAVLLGMKGSYKGNDIFKHETIIWWKELHLVFRSYPCPEISLVWVISSSLQVAFFSLNRGPKVT